MKISAKVFACGLSLFFPVVLRAKDIEISRPLTVEPGQERKFGSEKEKMLLAITSAHNAALGKANLLTKQISLQDKNTWYSMMREVGKYVEKTSSGFMSTYKKLLSVSNELFNTLATNYANNVSEKSYLNKIDISSFVTSRLSGTLNEVAQLHSKLKKERILFTSKRNVRDVLQRLALSLEDSIKKVFSDFKKL